MPPIDEAVAAFRRPGAPCQAELARIHKVDLSTLSRRLRGVHVSKDQANFNKSLLSKQQQLSLVTYINELCDNGLPPMTSMVRNFAEEIAHQRPGKNWVSRFNNTHNSVLSSGYLTGADQARTKADNWYEYKKYFELVSSLFLP
jgi:Tc5 transposase DNA-binding domain